MCGDCKTSQPRRAVGARAARGSPSDRAWTERHGCWARYGGEATRINERRRRRRRSWRWRGCAESDAPAYPRRRDDENTNRGKFGQAVNQVPFAHSRWRLTCTVTALAVEWFIRIDRESCTVPSSSQNRHFEPRPKALPQLSVRWRRPVWRPYVGPLRLTRHDFVLRGHALGT